METTTSSKRPRVLFVTHQLSLGGAPRVALRLLEALQCQIEVRVLALEPGPLQSAFAKVAEVRVVQEATYRYHPARVGAKLRQRGLATSVERWVREFDPEVIFLNTVGSILVLRSLNLPKLPIVLYAHEMGIALKGFWDRDAHLLEGWNVRHITVSEAAKQSFCERTGISAGKVEVVYPCASVPVIENRHDSRSEEVQIVIGGAGTVEWRKGVQTWLLMAAAVLREVRRERVRFVWLGVKPGEMETEIVKAQAEVLGIEDSVEFLPSTPDPFPVYAHMDIFAMTSWEDPCPLVVMENMLLGNAVVAFRGGGGAAEEIGEAGVVVEEFSPEAMAAEVVELVKEKELRARLGTAARKRAAEMFDCQRQAEKILAILQTCA